MDLENTFLDLFLTVESTKSGLKMIRMSLRGQNLKSQKIDFWPKIRPKIGVFVTFEAINFHVLLSKFAHLLFQT